MSGDKGFPFALGDPHGNAEAVCDEGFALDPTANSAGRNAEVLSDLVDRIEFLVGHLVGAGEGLLPEAQPCGGANEPSSTGQGQRSDFDNSGAETGI